MIQIRHQEKVLWEVVCTFRSLPEESYYYRGWDGYPVLGKRRSRQQWDYLHRAYYYCTQVDPVFIGSFKDFEEKVTGTFKNPYKRVRYVRWLSAFKRRFLRIPSKYKKRPTHTKKVLTDHELAKRDWREVKQFRKDRYKGYRRRSCGGRQFFVNLSNRQHRQWERLNLHHGIYDMGDRDYKYFCDPWLWD